jgi:hypothetical protein
MDSLGELAEAIAGIAVLMASNMTIDLKICFILVSFYRVNDMFIP